MNPLIKEIRPALSIPFFLVHLACLLVFWVGWSWPAVLLALGLYVLRMFAITGGLHRYFSHRTFKTHRWFQAVLGFLATTSAQLGPLWWAAHHRHHHKSSDQPDDIHSPRQHGFFMSHMGWILHPKYTETRWELVKDWTKYPELVWLDKNSKLPPLILAGFCLAFGGIFGNWLGWINITAAQSLVWGFFVSTTALYHATFTINSLAHVWGTRRFETSDDSRNNWFLALVTLGEGWHNNHHRFPNSERQGLRWWEVDITHYILRGLELLGIVWDIKTHDKQKTEAAIKMAA